MESPNPQAEMLTTRFSPRAFEIREVSTEQADRSVHATACDPQLATTDSSPQPVARQIAYLPGACALLVSLVGASASGGIQLEETCIHESRSRSSPQCS